jgi:hypothetical protein
MAEALHTIIMQTTKLALDKVKFLFSFCDEITLIDNQS